MASGTYNRGKLLAANGTLATATLRVIAIGTGYTFDATHNTVSDIIANELSGTGATRAALTGFAATENDAQSRAEIDFADFSFTAINAGTMKGFAVYRQTGGSDATPSDDDLVSWHEWASPVATNGGDINGQIPATGLLHIT